MFPLRNFLFEKNLNFVGRENIIVQIQSELFSSKQIVLSGMPGVGKTQVAIEYGYRHKNTYQVIWYLQAQSISHLRASYLSLALALKAEGINENAIIDSAKQKLQQLKDSYLLVFDNVKNPDDINPYLPVDGKGHVFITTQLGDETKWNGKVLKLDLFTEEECLELLRKSWKKEIAESEKQAAFELVMEDEEPSEGRAWRAEQSGCTAVEPFVEAASLDAADAGRLRPSAEGGQTGVETECERGTCTSRFASRRPALPIILLNQLLGKLPLGIVQAAKFMMSRNLTIVEFVEKFQTNLIEFLSQEGLENYPISIFTGFNNVLEIPEIAFSLKAFLIEESKEFNQELLQKPLLGLLKSRAYLVNYGLIQNQNYVPHPLVAAIIKNRATLEDKSKNQKANRTSYETIASEYSIPTLAGIFKSSAMPTSSSKLLNNHGETFYVREHNWVIQQLDFYFGDDAHTKIFLKNIKAGNSKIACYRQLVPVSEPKFPMYKFLFSRNLSFKQWGNYIEQIQAQLKKEGIVVLTGMAGIGKTQLAMQFAYSSEEPYELIWSFLAQSKESLEVSYLLLAAALNVIAAQNETLADVVRKTKEKLENLNKPFLLLFDGVINQKMLEPYLPKTGHIIITSRLSSDWPFQSLELERPTLERAYELFSKLLLENSNGKRQIRADEIEHAKYLVKELLGCLPLAITQAVKHIAKTNITIQQYISYFTTDLTKLWQHEEHAKDYFGVLKTAWDHDYGNLSDITNKILQYLSCLFYADIDANILKQLIHNRDEYEQTISRLVSNHLIEKTEIGFKVHPLLQLSIREKLFQEPELLLDRLKYLVLILQTDTEKHIAHLKVIKTISERLSNHWLQCSSQQMLQLESLLSDIDQYAQAQLPVCTK